MKIVVRRQGALGDVILTTPIIRRLRRENPDAEIIMQTGYPDVYRNNPHCAVTSQLVVADRIVDLNLAYENRPRMHIVDAYMMEAFGDSGEPADRRQELFFDRTPAPVISSRPVIAVHAAQAGWASRTLPTATWVAVCDALRATGLEPILVGTERDALPHADLPKFFVPDILAQARVIASCACFVGSDSALLHVAGATDTPLVGIFTCAKPAYRLPYRDRVGIVEAGLACIGCLERAPVPNIAEFCDRTEDPPFACVRAVRASDIVETVLNAIGG